MNRNYLIVFVIVILSILPLQKIRANETLIIFHLDFNSVSLNKDYIKKWLLKASDMGYNAVLWEIEDDVKWETCPECVSPDAFTKKEFKELLEYSRALGLEPIPLLQTIGHAEYVLQNKKYFSLREDSSRYDCYCTSNNDVKIFLKNWISEYLELFGELKYFHLGGDEAYAFATCDICKNKAEKNGENNLYAEYLNDIAKPLLEKSIRPGIWSDMMLSHPNQIKAVSKEFIIWDWNYWDGDSTPDKVMVWGKGRLSKENMSDSILKSFPEIVDEKNNLIAFYTSDVLTRLGYDVILCSTSRSHGDGVFAGRNDLHVDNIVGAARKTIKNNLLGNCVTSWAVRFPNYEIQEPWFYLAPLTINNPILTLEELLLKTSKDLFSYDDIELFKDFSKIGYSFTFANTNTTGIMWTGLKDSRSAPESYINDLITRWKERDQWNSTIIGIKIANDTISAGINNFNKKIPKVTQGMEILYHWSKAGHFQYWQSLLANEIVNTADGKPTIPADEIIILIQNLREEYKNWAELWMTPISAEQSSGLIYDAIQDYFKQKYIN